MLLCNTLKKMKIRISATIDEKTGDMLGELVKDGEFRNRSHVIEKAVELLMETKNEN